MSRLSVVFLSLMISTVGFGASHKKHHQFEKEVKIAKPKLHCVPLTDKCSACNDGQLRNAKGTKKTSVSNFECATAGKFAKNLERQPASFEWESTKCQSLSEFCAVCSDGSFVFTPKKQHINTDMYECSTQPRLGMVK